jgi:hypothetical protein
LGPRLCYINRSPVPDTPTGLEIELPWVEVPSWRST